MYGIPIIDRLLAYHTITVYLLQAFGHCPNDPVICLSLAVASLGRAMQRQADNRNYMVVQVSGHVFMFTRNLK